MAQRKPTKDRTFQFGTICLNGVLNPNLRFNSPYSQNPFEEYKVIGDNFFVFKTTEFFKPKSRICLWKNYVSSGLTFTKPLESTYLFRNPKISKPQNLRKSRKNDKRFENQYSVKQSNQLFQ